MSNIHPIIVHFTIALFSLAVLFEILGWLFRIESMKVAGWWNLLFAVPAAVAAVGSGLYAASSAPHNEVIHEVIEIHQTVGFAVLSVIIFLFVWRTIAHGKYVRKLPVLYSLAGIVGFGLLVTGAYFGGELVFTHGVGVKPVMEQLALQPHDHSSHSESSKEHGDTSENYQEETSHHDRTSLVSDDKKESKPDIDHDHSSHQH